MFRGFWRRLEIKCLISIQHFTRCNYGSVISQFRVLASHTGSLGSVAQGAWKLDILPFGWCHFLSDPCMFGYIFYEKVPIETFYISS